jgi:hypothetical protein
MNIDNKIGHALGIGREIDDETRIAGLVELVKSVHGLYEAGIDAADETFAELEGEANAARDQNLADLREAQRNVSNLINLLAAIIRNISSPSDEEE